MTPVSLHKGVKFPVITEVAGKAFTVIVIPGDVAGDPERHGVALDVISTVITSALARVVDV